MEPKTCDTCKREFTPRRYIERCCSRECSAIRFRKLHPYARKTQQERKCAICEQPFIATTHLQKTCGGECSRELRLETSRRIHAEQRNGKSGISDAELERKLNELWERKATPDHGRQQRSAIADIGAWV